MSSLAHYLSDVVGKAFEAQGLDPALGAVRVSDRPDLAQFQCNGAMAAAKQAKKNPREIAQGIVDFLSCHSDRPEGVEESKVLEEGQRSLDFARDDIFNNLEIAGPGFINIDLTDDFIAQALAKNSQSDSYGVEKIEGEETIVLDYGGPNIAKAMHVGHLRSSIIGDALRRFYLFAGYKALGDVHLGDWGTPMGMILSELDRRGNDTPITMDYLAEIYPQAAQACKDDEARMAEARQATHKLQEGDPEYTKRWREFVDVSIAGMKENFSALGVHFDLWKGEADAHPYIEDMIAALKDSGHAQESDGALIVPVEREDDKKEIPPLILLKSDRAVLYGTTDLATLVQRMQDYQPDSVVYIVDQRQSLHFEQVFRAARKGGIVPETVELIHAGFGTMNGPDGKPFKTRAGGVMKLEDLISMGLEKARARLAEADLARDMDEAEREDVARNVSLAAIKFADLHNQRQSDYVFDLDRMTSFEGKTGPYLLYQAVRIKSLLRKAAAQGHELVDTPTYDLRDEDRPLALLLCEFPDHFEQALKNHTPHVLCDYAYKLAQTFSSFYGNCHILSEEDEVLRTSRLQLCKAAHDQLETVLTLLGMNVPQRM